MLIIDTTTILHDGCLEIPTYHRGHLSLKSGTEITTCLLPLETSLSSPTLSEVIVSPIRFGSWQYLTRVSAVFHDHPGIVRKLAHALKHSEVDVLYEESASTESGRYHQTEFLVDPANIYRKFEQHPDTDSRVLASLERRLTALCLNEIVIDRHRPRLKVRGMEGLRNAWNAYNNSGKESIKAQDRSTVNGGVLRIPEKLLNLVRQDKPSRAILVSDTKERLLRLLFPNGDTGFTYIRVEHHDRIGAIALITSQLAQAFNAILTLNRLKTQNDRNDVELLLFSSEFPTDEHEETRKLIAEKLLTHSDVRHLGIRVSYPKQSGAQGPAPKEPRSCPSTTWTELSDLVPLESDLNTKSTTEILRNRIIDYQKSADSEVDLGLVDSHQRRINAAKHLLVNEGSGPLPCSKIFISYDFSHQPFADIVRKETSKSDNRYNIIDGKNAVDAPLFRDVIVSRIVSSSGFIAIWRPRGDGGHSPWLLWELAVAQTMGMPFCLFVHSSVQESPHLSINSEKHHVVFEDLNFENVVTGRLPQFLVEVDTFERKRIKRRDLFAQREDNLWRY